MRPCAAMFGALLFVGCAGRACGRSDVPTAVDRVESPHLAVVDALVEKHFGASGPGVAVAVVSKGVVMQARGYGLADVEGKQAVTHETKFDLASVSKQFTAALVLLEVERGTLNLEDPIDAHLPALPRPAAKRPIRVIDLLQMTSGLPDYTEDLEQFPDRTVLENRHVVAWTAAHASEWQGAGKRWTYCNTNYVLLAAILEKLEREGKKPTPYELGKHLFGRFKSGKGDLAENHKTYFKEAMRAKHRR